MLTLFYVLAFLLTVESLYALREGFAYLGYVRRSRKRELPPYAPPASLVCPCKGLDQGFEENVRALLAQDYPDCEILFAIAEESDPARAVLERLIRESRRPSRIVIAGRPSGRGEKVNNLLHAVAAVRPESEVLVFVDSDARPPTNWMRELVRPLADETLGATTGFRWYLPVRGGFASALQSAWNAPLATLLGDHSHNFCWGGSTAIRKDTFERVRTTEYWAHAVSDDYALTRALRDAERRIVFVPACLIATHQDASLPSFLSWATRQLLITRVYAPHLWYMALAAHGFYCGTVLFGLTLAFLLRGERAVVGWILGLLGGTALLAVAKGALRWRAVRELLQEHRSTIDRYWWSTTLLAALVPWVMMYCLLASAVSRRLRWRGVTYELRSPQETRVLGTEEE